MSAAQPRLKPTGAVRWAAFLVIFVLLVSPGSLFAAPALQEVDPALVGTWESVVSQAGETVTVSLFPDGTVSGLSTYAENDSQILYGGTWESTGEDTFVLYVDTVDGEAQADPVEFVGLVTRRGLRLPDAPDWGRNGMSLTLVDENPTDFSAEAATQETGEEEVVAEETPVAEEEGTVEEGTEEGTETTTSGFAGVYGSGEIVDDSGATTIVTITLFDDGSMETVTTFESATQNDTSFETGTWVAEDDGSLTITYEAVNGQAYDPAVPITFVVDGDTISAPALAAFGENGLVVTRIDDAPVAGEVVDEPEVDEPQVDESEVVETEVVTDTVTAESEGEGSSIAGLYTAAPVENGGGVVAGIMVYIDDEGFAQSLVIPFTGDRLPISRTGEWFDNEDGTITIVFGSELLFDSLSESVEAEELESEEALDFEVGEGMLINPELTLYSAGQVISLGSSAETGVGEEAIEEEAAAEETAEESATEESATEESATEELIDETAATGNESVTFVSPLDTILGGTTASLALLEDGTASLSVVSSELASAVVEVGTWELDEETATVTVTLAMDGLGQTLAEPTVLVFTFDEATDTLTPGDYDTDHYGPNLMLERVGY